MGAGGGVISTRILRNRSVRNKVLSDLFTVYSSKEKPDNASVKVQYRGNWFYIRDNDMQSKYTLMLLNQISALQSGVIEKVGPVLTIPVSQ